MAAEHAASGSTATAIFPRKTFTGSTRSHLAIQRCRFVNLLPPPVYCHQPRCLDNVTATVTTSRPEWTLVAWPGPYTPAGIATS